jgi:hypothetical protein
MDERELENALDVLREGTDDAARIEASREILDSGDPEARRILHEVRVASAHTLFGHALDELLLDRGSMVDLTPYVSEAWFESMIKRIDGFEEVCDVVGYRFMAYALIIGINLRSVLHNPEYPAESSVEFVIGDETEVQEAGLEDFRKMLIHSLLSEDPATRPVTLPPGRDEVARLVGVRYLLLSPLYGVKPRKLYILDQSRGTSGYSIQFDHEGETQEWTLGRFRELLRDFVSSEQIREPAARGRFAAEDVRTAEKALSAGNTEKALDSLRDWILFVRNYRLTGSVAQLVGEPDALFARGLLLTGRAYRLLDRNRLSEDLLRFSIQLLPGGTTTSKFYCELALIMMSEGRFAEAIGPLRHAEHLGASQERIYPHLARALLECDRNVSAALLFGELNREGLLDEEGTRLFEEARRRLGSSRALLEDLGNGHLH